MMIRSEQSMMRSLFSDWRVVMRGLARTEEVVPMRAMRESVVRIAPSRKISRRLLMVMMVACWYRTEAILICIS